MDTWSRATTEYVLSMRARNLSPGTIRLHTHYLRHLARYAGRPSTTTPAKLRRALGEPTWSAETRKSARSVAASFFSWAHREGIVETNPAATLDQISVPQGKPRPAPESVVAQALTASGPRERLMVLLAAHAGLRCCEIARVHRQDLVDGLLRVNGKGGKVRLVPLEHPELVNAITRADGWLFPGRTDGHLTAAHVSKLIGRVLPRPWTAHTLRHRMATKAYAGTRDLLAVGEVLGHSRPETTRRYVLTPPDALLAAIRAAA